MEGIQIYELKRMDLRGATVIDGFPSVGLVSSIVANYLINALNLTQIGIMDSIYFPTVALVRDGQPMNPVRIYAGPKMDDRDQIDRKSTRLNSSHSQISYAVFCLKKKKER